MESKAEKAGLEPYGWYLIQRNSCLFVAAPHRSGLKREMQQYFTLKELHYAGSPNLDKPEQHILANRTPDEGTGPVSLFRFPECKNL